MRHLSKAPIKEAVIDLHVNLADDIVVTELGASSILSSLGYPEENKITEGSIGLKLEQNQSITTNVENKHLGYRYTSEDRTKVVQFRLDGFTFSQLEPYESWDEMRKEAMKLWNIYLDIANPSSVIRVATRFINILRIPMPVGDIDDYLTEAPKIPKQLPQLITSFSSRVVIQEPKLNANAIIIQSFGGIDNDNAPITLDIDVFVTKEFSAEQTEYWDCLEELRVFKNRVFEHSVTEKTVELFK